MTTKKIRKILVRPEVSSSGWGAFFEELGFELHFKFILGNDYLFALDDACAENLEIARIKTKEEISSHLSPFVRGYISESYLTSLAGRKLLASYFSDGLEFDLVDRYSKEFKNIYTLKIHEYLSIGFFTDMIITEAYKSKFNINALRKYLNAALDFSFKKLERTDVPMPLDVSYSHNGEAFAVQISMAVNEFSGLSEVKESLEVLTKNSNFFDITYFHKKKKVTLSCLLFKEKKLAMRAHFFTEVSRKTRESELEENLEKNGELFLADDSQTPPPYEFEKPDHEEEKAKKIILARRLATFIKMHRSRESTPRNLEDLQLNDIDDYLKFHPKKEMVSGLDEEIKNMILNFVKDEKHYDDFSEHVQKIAGHNLDSEASEIQRILGNKNLEEVEEIIISGTKEEGEEALTRVRAWSEGNNNEKWAIKRTEINKKIQEEVVRVKSEGKNIIQDDIIRVVSKELNADNKDVATLVRGIVEEVISAQVVKNKKLEESLGFKILVNQEVDQVKEKLESQMQRMKKVMLQMKTEIVRLELEKKEKAIHPNGPSEALLEKTKRDFDLINKKKDQNIEELVLKIKELKEEHAKSREFANEEKLLQLETENKSLMAKIELSNKKLNIISENMGKKESDSLEKNEREIVTLKSNLQIAQSVIEKFKQEKIEIENRLSKEKEESRKLKDELKKTGAGISKEELADKEVALNTLRSERKIIEEKFKAQGIELKKLEQKLKFTVAQLESANKRKPQAPPAGQKSIESYAKLSEHANNKLAEITAEMGEKKKEAIKLKQENTILTNKVLELERKLSSLEKKAA